VKMRVQQLGPFLKRLELSFSISMHEELEIATPVTDWRSYKADKLLCLGYWRPFAWGAERGSILGFPQERRQLCREICHQVAGCPLEFQFPVFGCIHRGDLECGS
jgi:hypothetical protein